MPELSTIAEIVGAFLLGLAAGFLRQKPWARESFYDQDNVPVTINRSDAKHYLRKGFRR